MNCGNPIQPRSPARLLAAICSLIVMVLGIGAPRVSGEDFKLLDGREYRRAIVRRTEPDGIVVVTKTGIVKLYFFELPEETRAKYHYDAANAAAYSASQSLQQLVLTEQIQRGQAAEAAQHSPPPPSALPQNPPSPKSTTASAVLSSPRPADETPATKGVVLNAMWDGVMQGGSETIKDLDRLLSPHVMPALNLGPASIDVYQGIRYLMPLFEAISRLKLQGIKSKNEVICPGIPRSSFFYYAFDGNFDGEYNRLYLVTDAADQVVSVQLVAENPRDRTPHSTMDWYCSNFINYRVKAVADVRIEHDVRTEQNGALLRVDSVFFTPMKRRVNRRHGYQYEATEAVRWFVPRPLAELILFNVKKAELRR